MKVPVWIDERTAIVLHDRLRALYAGAPERGDDTLRKGALTWPQRNFADAKSPDIIDMAATYTASLMRDLAFDDGNRCTGFLLGILLLELNGYRFTASEESAALAAWELAAERLDESGYGAFLRGNVTRLNK